MTAAAAAGAAGADPAGAGAAGLAEPAGPDRPRPDDGLLGGIVRLNLAVSGVLEEITGAFGVPMADYLVLGVIRGAPGGRSAPTAIAEVLARTTGGMTLTLDRLVTSGWVRRSPDPVDGRRVVVELTDQGHDLAVAVNASLHEWEAGLELRWPRSSVAEMVDGLTTAVDRHRGAPTRSAAASAPTARAAPTGRR